VTFAELQTQINAIVGDRQDDEALHLLENVADTLNTDEDWRAKYEAVDADWRKKYRERFNGGGEEQEPPKEQEEPPKEITFDDLFEKKEEK
jgi:hypothetical protein